MIRRRDFVFRQGRQAFFTQAYRRGTSSTKKGSLTQDKDKITNVTSRAIGSSWQPARIIVEQSVAKEEKTQEILAKFKDVSVEQIDDVKTIKSSLNSNQLLLARQKGSFLKKCPGTPKYRCCDYYVLNLGIGCSFNCTYCFLHHYMNTPFTVFVNIDEAIEEVRDFCSAHPNRTIRLGSGEFVDSVGFDEIADFNKVLIPALSNIDNLVFEVKTKSPKVDGLLGLKHRDRVVVSFSLNSEKVIAKEEKEASTLESRIRAAKLCQEAGYKIGFHFDPLIYYTGWQEGYAKVVEQIFKNIRPENIAWISLGALRFNKALKPVIEKKFPTSSIVYEEMVPGLDGKLRYFIAIRKKMFGALMDNIRSYSKEVPVYLCMENKSLAEEVGAIAGFSLN